MNPKQRQPPQLLFESWSRKRRRCRALCQKRTLASSADVRTRAFNSAATAAAEPSLSPAENWRAAHGTARQLTYVKPHYRFAPWATRRVIGSEAVVANC